MIAALLPALVAMGALLLAQRTRAQIAGLAVALGYLAAHTVLLGPPELEPVAAVERLPWVVLVLGVLVALGGTRPGSVGDAALLLTCVAGAWWITESARANEFEGSVGGLVLGGLALVAHSCGQIVRTISKKAPSWAPPLLLAFAAFVLAPALVLGRSAVLAQLCGAVCAACAAATILCRRQRFEELGVFVAAAAAPMIPFLAVCGALYAYLDPRAAACLALCPLAAAVGLRKEEDWSPARGFGAMFLVCAVGLWLAYLGLPAPSSYDY